MSLRILKSGWLDSLQDAGRFGYQHLGINPGGVMDDVAMRIANALAGNAAGEAVLEMHFPAPVLQFETDMLVAWSGADFGAVLNGQELGGNQTVLADAGSKLQFIKKNRGARCYLSVHGGFQCEEWLQSKSTHLKLNAGGYLGRALQKEDLLGFQQKCPFHFVGAGDAVALPWKANTVGLYRQQPLRILPAREYALLQTTAQQALENQSYRVAAQSDRMGYRLTGLPLFLRQQKEMSSTAVTRGCIQLLPDGQLIVLMADHQTTGGYPRVAQVIRADLASLAQVNAGESVSFQMTDTAEAETALLQQQMHLQQLQNACIFRLQEYLNLY